MTMRLRQCVLTFGFDRCGQLDQAHAQRLGDQADRDPRGRSLPQLDPSDSARRDARAEGERFLSHAAILAQAAQRGGEPWIGW